MHRIWQIPELLVHIISFLPVSDINRAFDISHHFRNALKANLAPQLRPLPESSTTKSQGCQTLPQDVRDRAAEFGIHDAAVPPQMKMEDVYYYWCEDARRGVLDTLSPHLHPVLGKYATCLIDGFDALAAGKMRISLQVEIPYHELYELVHGERRDDHHGLLAVKPPTTVTVFCLGGVCWDLLYANVNYRDYGNVKRFSVRVEGDDGVRMSDVLDELNGTLVVDGLSGGLGQDVAMIWMFDDE